ncbi:Golgi apparatus membrane protein-like protein ECHIDNA [Impatiens glandulifera]|uniref:Golgi apparatus membrane protein-like protein ECHIDNA n=1 Tax=Impatiens glandulifera TaxID=253017 RepID=UPI001FB17699|nr:Golgi apparatus membrane protein-like protein ECHIDNA [Impatiens glandulifera]
MEAETKSDRGINRETGPTSCFWYQFVERERGRDRELKRKVSDLISVQSLATFGMDLGPPPGENYANPNICFFHVVFKAAALAFYILSTLFVNSFVIIFVITVLLTALDFWVVKNVSGRILVGLRWWNEINDDGESVWKFECLDQESLARMNKKDSWLFWWTLYLSAVAWLVLGIFSLIKFQADYLLVVAVCLTLNAANIVGFTKCRKDAKKQLQDFATQTIASRFSSTIQTAFSVV